MAAYTPSIMVPHTRADMRTESRPPIAQTQMVAETKVRADGPEARQGRIQAAARGLKVALAAGAPAPRLETAGPAQAGRALLPTANRAAHQELAEAAAEAEPEAAELAAEDVAARVAVAGATAAGDASQGANSC